MADQAENSNEFEISLSNQSNQQAKGKNETQTIQEAESKTSEEAEERTDELSKNEKEAEQEESEFLDVVETPLKEISGMTEVTPDDDEQEKSSQAPTEPMRRGSKTGSSEMSEAEVPDLPEMLSNLPQLPKEEAELYKEFEIMQEMGPRIRASMADEEFLAGFEIDADIIIALDDISPEEEQSIVEEEEEIVVLDRAPYYERHDKAYEMMRTNKIRNLILQKKLSMYFKRKKMDDATREIDWSLDQQNKYFRKLELYGELIEYAHQERETTNKDIEVIKANRENKFKELTAKFKKMQSREGEIGYGLINTKTGNVIPDKLVQRLIHRQSLQMEQVCSMRLKFIKLKQMVQEKLDAIAILDEVAPGFLLADYEHLKILNQGFADKIEEREEELVRLRAKCVNSIQMLAHIREKSAAMQNDLESLKDDLAEADDEMTQVRWKLNSIKKQREIYRQSLTKLQNECGLLTKPTLLRDMEQGLIDVKVLSANLELVVEEHKKRAQQIKTIRKKIEMANEMRHISKKASSRAADMYRSASKLKSTIYKGRPSLMIPIIEDDAFYSLKSIKPKITYDRRRYDGGIKHKRTEG